MNRKIRNALFYLLLNLALTPVAATHADAFGGQEAKLKQGNTWYRQTAPGGAPTLVLVHGFAISSLIWERNVEALSGAGFNVVLYDQYGRGNSDHPADAYSLEALSDQLRELIAALEVNGPVYVICVSAGCPIGARYVAVNPGQVDGLVLVDPQVSSFSAPSRSKDADAAARERDSDVDGLQQHIELAYQEIAARWKMQRSPGFAQALDEISVAQAGIDPFTEYARLTDSGHPLALIQGELDRGQQRRAELAKLLPSMQYYEVAGAAHGSNFHAPRVFNELLLRFLARSRAAGDQ